jgi:hypothetical protein
MIKGQITYVLNLTEQQINIIGYALANYANDPRNYEPLESHKELHEAIRVLLAKVQGD